MEHYLKTWPIYFDRLEKGVKTFEIRKNDRDFQVGDVLILQEFEPKDSIYTDKQLSYEVTYVLTGPFAGLDAGYCIMGIKALTKEEE